MQGRQYVANLERKGPHKSMHCKFCKPPGVVTPEKPARPTLETKTKFHLAHEGADLKLCEVHDEPGLPVIESEACICVLEGDSPCPKCVPDKNRIPPKKKTCRCAKGAKPHSSMFDGTTPKKKKKKEEDDEFWWEKQAREHDALAKETWAAYTIQRRKEKALLKNENRERKKILIQSKSSHPFWFQKLSIQQVIYVEFLSKAIRLDSDENITDRTRFVLAGLGLYPRPRKKLIEKCIKFSHYNAIQFLNQFLILTKDTDPFNERGLDKSGRPMCTWNDRLIMSSLCHLELPAMLREIMDRLPPLKRDKILPQIPYPVFPQPPEKKYKNPYEEPLWKDSLNWDDKMRIDRINKYRAHMNNKRVKIPPLALVRRPSLIDARPAFMAEFETKRIASRRVGNKKKKKVRRRYLKKKFDSNIDVTAIAEVAASDVSDKADLDDLCVFLREPLKDSEMMGEGGGEEEGEREEEEIEEAAPEEEIEVIIEKDIKFSEEEPEVATYENNMKLSESEEFTMEPESIPFVTPPKTESGTTIVQPCDPPKSSPAPPAFHYRYGKRELDVVNEEVCGFFPFITESTQTMEPIEEEEDEPNKTTQMLISAAKKLQEFVDRQDSQVFKKKTTKKIKIIRKKETRFEEKGKLRRNLKKGKKTRVGYRKLNKRADFSVVKESTHENEEYEENEEEEEEEMEGEVDFNIGNANTMIKTVLKKTDSDISDPDSDSDSDDALKFPCLQLTQMVSEIYEENKDKLSTKRSFAKKKKKLKKKGKKKNKRKTIKRKTRKGKKNKKKKKQVLMSLREESLEYIKKKIEKAHKTTMTETYPGEYDYLYGAPPQPKKDKNPDVFKGNPFSLLHSILSDLADEGFVSASWPFIEKHPDIEQLVKYLQGKILTKQEKINMHLLLKEKWGQLKVDEKFPILELGISHKKAVRATWNDKRWISKIAQSRSVDFYFKVAKCRAEYGKKLYNTLCQNFIVTTRFMKIFYAYMVSKFEDVRLIGPDGLNC